ncbi:MAG: DUF4270 family protein [Bacteroidia bacterium]
MSNYSNLNPDSFFAKLPGFLLIAVSALIYSCKEPDLGLEVQDPADVVNLLRTDSFTIRTTMERQDSVRSDELSANLLGAYNDPLLGNMRASFYTQLVPTVSNINLGEGFIPDSMVMVIPYRGFYGDISKLSGLQRFTVYRVLENMSRDEVYFSNKVLLTETQALGNTGFIVPRVADSVTVTGNRDIPQMRIPINLDLAADFAANGSSLLSIEAFTEFFKGVYVEAENFNTSPGNGAILDLILTSGARLDLFYKNNEADSLRVSFVVNDNSARYTRFNHTYKQEINDIIQNPALAAERTYTQTMAGLRTRIDFPNLKTWQNGRTILVNEAKLYVPVIAADISIYSPNPILDLVTKNSDGNLVQTPDLIIGGNYPGGAYDSENKEYVFNIARYVQGQLNDILDDNGLFIQSNGTAVSAYRVPLYGASAEERKVRLEILYQILPN